MPGFPTSRLSVYLPLMVIIIRSPRCRSYEKTVARRRHRRVRTLDGAPDDVVEQNLRRAIGLRKIHLKGSNCPKGIGRVLLVERNARIRTLVDGQVAGPGESRVHRRGR